MIKTIQILKFLKQSGHSVDGALGVLREIYDNQASDLFDLSAADVASISAVFEDDEKLESALVVVFNL